MLIRPFGSRREDYTGDSEPSLFNMATSNYVGPLKANVYHGANLPHELPAEWTLLVQCLERCPPSQKRLHWAQDDIETFGSNVCASLV